MAKHKSANVCASCNQSIKQLHDQVIQSEFFRTDSDAVQIGSQFNHNMETIYKKYLKLELALQRAQKWSQDINDKHTEKLSVIEQLESENSDLKSRLASVELKLQGLL